MWPDVEDILTASTDKDCDINILPDPQMDWSSITAFKLNVKYIAVLCVKLLASTIVIFSRT